MRQKTKLPAGIFGLLLLSGCVATPPYQQAPHAGTQQVCAGCGMYRSPAPQGMPPARPVSTFSAKPHTQAYRVAQQTEVRSGPGHEYPAAYRLTDGAIVSTEAKLDNGWMKLASGNHYLPANLLSPVANAPSMRPSGGNAVVRRPANGTRTSGAASPAKNTQPPAAAHKPTNQPIVLDFPKL